MLIRSIAVEIICTCLEGIAEFEFVLVNNECIWYIANCTCLFCSGEGTVYHLDEMTGALVISHTLVISSKDYPGLLFCAFSLILSS